MAKKTCFVVSPIGDEGSEIRKHADTVLEHIIKPALESEFDVKRVDEIYHSDKIDEKIFELLINSDLVLVDITDNNPNVFLELGYRMALNKPTIYIRQETLENIPFDIRTINIISYDIKDGREKTLTNVKIAKERISNTANSLEYSPHSELDQESLGERLHRDVLEIKTTVNSIFDNLNKFSPLDKENASSQSDFQEKLLTMAMDDPDKLDNFLKVFSNYQNLFSSQDK